ncbi:type II toxin-antitoxin system RelE/ParE family toxin, partial [Flavihumibacter sediminis]|nr:type II toxin-antitoxin system RelE/ParE family toxin [Flavihumibacter sediminis]
MAAERRVQYSRKATLDLDRIWDYTAEAWGADQAEGYLESLRSTILTLSEMPQIARERRDLT